MSPIRLFAVGFFTEKFKRLLTFYVGAPVDRNAKDPFIVHYSELVGCVHIFDRIFARVYL